MTSTVIDMLIHDSDISPSGHFYRDLAVPMLIEQAITRHEAILAANGGLVATTGKRTGRSPGDKFVVRNAATVDSVEWGMVNQPMEQGVYDALRARALEYAQGKDLFLLHTNVGVDPDTRLPVEIVTEYAWHSLFARQLLIRLTEAELATHVPSFHVISLPGFHAEPDRDGTHSETAVVIDFERREVLIVGTEYAGEIKKSLFTVMNLLLPQQGVLPMHCSANIGRDGDVALFFGLSGTGKTSLSSDPDRALIGDDEHGWSDNGVFNLEGGCYAKCIRLRREAEPQIYDAIRFGAVIENVVVDPQTREPNYDDDSLTENTRVAYPLDYLANIAPGETGGHPRTIFFLTADASGILPPIARLTPQQAMYYFLSGYTSKLAGTEVGLGKEPIATFEACFGAPFLPLPAVTYATMLHDKLEQHHTRVYLLNTGWSGGPFGVGSRIGIGHTRTMVRAALDGTLDKVPSYVDARFGFLVPQHVPGVPDELMDPRTTWSDPTAYDTMAGQLVERFLANFAKFGANAATIAAAGPRLAQ